MVGVACAPLGGGDDDGGDAAGVVVDGHYVVADLYSHYYCYYLNYYLYLERVSQLRNQNRPLTWDLCLERWEASLALYALARNCYYLKLLLDVAH